MERDKTFAELQEKHEAQVRSEKVACLWLAFRGLSICSGTLAAGAGHDEREDEE